MYQIVSPQHGWYNEYKPPHVLFCSIQSTYRVRTYIPTVYYCGLQVPLEPSYLYGVSMYTIYPSYVTSATYSYILHTQNETHHKSRPLDQPRAETSFSGSKSIPYWMYIDSRPSSKPRPMSHAARNPPSPAVPTVQYGVLHHTRAEHTSNGWVGIHLNKRTA